MLGRISGICWGVVYYCIHIEASMEFKEEGRKKERNERKKER